MNRKIIALKMYMEYRFFNGIIYLIFSTSLLILLSITYQNTTIKDIIDSNLIYNIIKMLILFSIVFITAKLGMNRIEDAMRLYALTYKFSELSDYMDGKISEDKTRPKKETSSSSKTNASTS